MQNGVDLYKVKAVLGHSTIQVTECYAHLAPNDIRDTVAILDGSRSRFGHVSRKDDQEKVC